MIMPTLKAFLTFLLQPILRTMLKSTIERYGENDKAPTFCANPVATVVFLAYADHQPLDLVGPLQVFALANREGTIPGYEIVIAAVERGRVEASAGPSLMVDHGLEALERARHSRHTGWARS